MFPMCKWPSQHAKRGACRLSRARWSDHPVLRAARAAMQLSGTSHNPSQLRSLPPRRRAPRGGKGFLERGSTGKQVV